jgi:type II secretory pathway component PulC
LQESAPAPEQAPEQQAPDEQPAVPEAEQPEAAPPTAPRERNQQNRESNERNQAPREGDANRPEDSDRNRDARRDQPNSEDVDAGVEFDQDAEGLTVGEVAEGSVAAQAGLRAGDRIETVSGNTFDSPEQFDEFIREHSQERMEVVVFRDGRRQTLFIEPGFHRGAVIDGRVEERRFEDRGFDDRRVEGRRMDDGRFRDEPAPALLGIQVHQGQWGPVVEHVYRNSPADQAGLQPGDALIWVNGRRMCQMHDLASTLHAAAPGSRVNMRVFRDGMYHTMDATIHHREGVAHTDRDRALLHRERESFAPGSGRVGMAQRDREFGGGQPRTALRPDIDLMSRIEQMQQEIDALQEELQSLKRQLPESQSRPAAERREPSAPDQSSEDATTEPQPPPPAQPERE